MKCSVCSESRNETVNRQSKVLPSMSFNYCSSCDKGGFEPRFAIVLAARSFGSGAVSDYVRNHKYIGEKILAEDIL